MIYAVIDNSTNVISKKLIGYHDNKKVVGQYYYSLKQLENSDKFKFVKCKKKVLKKFPDYVDYYLVRFGRNYIPSAWYSMYKDDLQTLIFEYRHTMEILTRIFELEKLSQKDRDKIEHAILIMQSLIDKEMDCVIHPDMFRHWEDMYNQYKNKTFDYCRLNDDEWIPFLNDIEEIS